MFLTCDDPVLIAMPLTIAMRFAFPLAAVICSPASS